MKIFKSYNELLTMSSFEDRFRYLMVGGTVGIETFGFDRIFNQRFYMSKEWKSVRNKVITRDYGCDLGLKDYPIFGNSIVVHHINPISMEDLENHTDFLFDLNNLITVSSVTHNAIHYGQSNYPKTLQPIERFSGDTCPWRKTNAI